MSRRIMAACAAAMLSASQAAATASFDFAYESASPGLKIAGAFIGETLAGDPNKVRFISFTELLVNGVAYPLEKLVVVDSYDEVGGFATGLDPIVSFDGAFMDFHARDASFYDVFSIAAGSLSADDFGAARILINFEEGNVPYYSPGAAEFDASAWTLSAAVTSAVPVPAAGALLAGALGGAALLRRRRTRAA